MSSQPAQPGLLLPSVELGQTSIPVRSWSTSTHPHEPARAIFLDRDGVINENRDDHVKSWDEFAFLPGVLTALRMLRRLGLPIFIVTNQAIINRGLVAPSVLEDIHHRMVQQIRRHGGAVHDIRHCPHDSHEDCGCRKPRPGMLLELAARWNIDLARSYLVGDAWTDIAAGRAVRCRCIMVKTGRGAAHAQLPEARQHPADYLAPDLLGAVQWLLHEERLVQPAPALG